MSNNKINQIIFLGVLLFVCSTAYFSCNSINSTELGKKSSQVKKNDSKSTVQFDIQPLMDRQGALAELEEWAGIKQKGQNLYQKVRTTGDAKSALYLASIYTQEARITGEHPYYYNAAAKVLDVVLDNPPKEKILHYQALVSKASVMLSQHQFQQALDLGKLAINIEKNDAQVYGVLCDANVELGNYKEAVAMADRMNAIKPDLRSYARISYLRELFGEVDGAIEAMKMAVSAGVPGHENTAWARTTLANLYLEYGKKDEGVRELKTCMQERKDFPFAMGSLAEVELSENKIVEAEKRTDAALAIIPEFSFALIKADIQKKQGKTADFEQSKADLLEMMKEDSESGHNMNMELAGIYLDLFNQPEKALDVLKPEIQLRPKNTELNKILAKIYLKQENWQEMGKCLELAKRNNWKSPELAYLNAIYLNSVGDTKSARAILKAASDMGTFAVSDDLVKLSRQI